MKIEVVSEARSNESITASASIVDSHNIMQETLTREFPNTHPAVLNVAIVAAMHASSAATLLSALLPGMAGPEGSGLMQFVEISITNNVRLARKVAEAVGADEQETKRLCRRAGDLAFTLASEAIQELAKVVDESVAATKH